MQFWKFIIYNEICKNDLVDTQGGWFTFYEFVFVLWYSLLLWDELVRVDHDQIGIFQGG